eukprot:223289-Hanusia_phi.AAC.4
MLIAGCFNEISSVYDVIIAAALLEALFALRIPELDLQWTSSKKRCESEDAKFTILASASVRVQEYTDEIERSIVEHVCSLKNERDQSLFGEVEVWLTAPCDIPLRHGELEVNPARHFLRRGLTAATELCSLPTFISEFLS